MPDRLSLLSALAAMRAAAAARRRRAGPRGAALGRGAAHVLRADRQARGAGGRHRLGRQDRGEPQSADGGPVLPPLLRAAVRRAARADAAVARLRRHRRSVRPDRHQQSRHRRRRPGQDLARRQARVRGRCRAQGPARRSRGAARQGRQQGALPGDRLRQFRRVAGRRRGAGGRQSVRRRPDRDPRHRLGGGAHAGRHLRLSVLHPDRRRDQSRQFRRRAGRHGRAPGRHQHRDLLALGRLAGRRLRHSRHHGAGGGGLGRAPAAARSSGPGSAPSSRR